MSNEAQMTVEYFLDYAKQTKSKSTYKEYKNGIEKFCEWYGKTPNEVLELRRQDWVSGNLVQKKRFVRELEKFHKWLLEPIHKIRGKPNRSYSMNSARTYCLGIQQLFRFFEMPITIPTGSDVSRTVISTKDFVPTPEQYRSMFKVADNLRDKLIVSMGKDLGWRIGDFVKIQKDQLPILEAEPPIPFELITEKEDVIARSFLSAETVDLLMQYLPTLPKENPYLFPSTVNGKSPIDTDTINNVLRDLAEKAEVRIPKRKRLRFHCFRKRVLSECANLGIDINIAKILVGKHVKPDMLTYLSEIEHRQAFIRLHERLRLTKTPMRKTRESATDLEKRVDMLERMINQISVLNPEVVKKADAMLKELGVGTLPKASFIEKLRLIIEKEQAKQKQEYEKLIEENNDNNNNH